MISSAIPEVAIRMLKQIKLEAYKYIRIYNQTHVHFMDIELNVYGVYGYHYRQVDTNLKMKCAHHHHHLVTHHFAENVL